MQLLAGLTPDQLDRVARLLRPRLAVPDERLIAAGERGDAMYFISSGVVTVKGPGQAVGPPILLTRGDFFGEMALVLDQPRQADVIALCRTASCSCSKRRDFQGLVRSHRAIRTQIERAVADRARMNEARPESPQ